MRFPTTLLAAYLTLGSLYSQPTEDGLYAVFDTTAGEITTRLFYEKAPISCANFVGLAEGTVILWNAEGDPITGPFYDGLSIHRAVPGFLIQGGDPLADGTGGPGYYWPDEMRPDLTHDKAGILAVANSGPNTNGSQFYITLDSTPSLDGLYNIFGETISGIEVVEAISQLPTSGPAQTAEELDHHLSDPVLINSVKILRIGEAALAFKYADHLFPERFPANIRLIHPPQTDPLIRIQSLARSRYLIEASENLANWTDIGTIAGKFDSGDTHDLNFTAKLKQGQAAQFVRVSEMAGHLTRDASGYTLTVNSGQGETAYQERIAFGHDQLALYSDPKESYEAEYLWYELGNDRSQVWVYLKDIRASTPEIQYFLEWTSDNSGLAYIRDATPDYVEGETPDDWVLEGTFTYQK